MQQAYEETKKGAQEIIQELGNEGYTLSLSGHMFGMPQFGGFAHFGMDYFADTPIEGAKSTKEHVKDAIKNFAEEKNSKKINMNFDIQPHDIYAPKVDGTLMRIETYRINFYLAVAKDQ